MLKSDTIQASRVFNLITIDRLMSECIKRAAIAEIALYGKKKSKERREGEKNSRKKISTFFNFQINRNRRVRYRLPGVR